mgnify:CR=1 FL=1
MSCEWDRVLLCSISTSNFRLINFVTKARAFSQLTLAGVTSEGVSRHIVVGLIMKDKVS